MLKQSIIDLLMKQINLEMQSAYLYLGMANYYEDEDLSGFAHWFTAQASEEYAHANRIQNYLEAGDVKVELFSLDAVTADYENYGAPLKIALEHEFYITKSIHAIYDVAVSEKDYRTQQFLLWFIDEQLEEEDTVRTLIAKYEKFGDCSGGLRSINKEMGRRES